MAVFCRRATVNFLKVFWVLVIFWYELAVFSNYVKDCNWPDTRLEPDDLNNAGQPSRPAHVLLIADPQIIDQHSYPKRGVLLAYITRVLVDLNLRKNWRVALKKRPDAVLFLGDMMDNGRYDMPDEEYEAYYRRFRSIFRSDGIPQYFIPGNHDTGLGKALQFSSSARRRYVEHFGIPNQEISIANHSLILFDAPAYADEDAKRQGQRKVYEDWIPEEDGAVQFMQSFSRKQHTDPVILFTHIPLYRPDGKYCGPLRERGTIRPGLGLGYQNLLEKQATIRLFQSFKPTAVFSGDDHDYCFYTHRLAFPGGQTESIPETTVKSLSMVMNVRHPGFQLLSLVPAGIRTAGKQTYADRSCILPDQLGIYMYYILFFATSLMAVFASNIRNVAHLKYNNITSNAHQKILSNANTPNDSQSDTDQTELDPFYSNGLPTPVSSSKNRMNRTVPRSTKSGWLRLRDSVPLYVRGTILSRIFGVVKDAIRFLTLEKHQGGLSRRTWLGSSLIDVRDIAVFPLGLFLLINWWLTYS